MTRLFVKKLTNIDFSYLDADRGLVGESWLLDIELSGNLNEQGMVLDFGIVKKLVRDYVDQHIDHCLLVPTGYEGCDVLDSGDELEIAFYLHNGQTILHRSKHNAIARIPRDSITTNSIRSYLLEKLMELLPENVKGLDLNLYTEPGLEGNYQYSHGLRKHEGNCQRIAHGHRSSLEVYVDGKRSSDWEEHWFLAWKDIYIGTHRHLIHDADNSTYYEFKYQAPQGEFYLKLPKKSCYLIEAESTVENIAEHLLIEMEKLEPGKSIKVRAFEGIAKGAIAENSVQ